MVSVKINGKEIRVGRGATILEAAQKAGEKIPTLCYIKDLFPSGACRMCIVEAKGRPNLIPACSYPAEEGMEIQTRSPRVLNARRTIIELLLASHPFDCLTCARNGGCELQGLAAEYSITDVPFKGKARHHYTDFSSPSIVRDPDKCILCGRCVRVCEEMQGVSAVDFTKRGFDTMVLPALGKDLSQTTCVNCGQCVLACPTGALSDVSSINNVIQALQDRKKYLVAQVAPAIRVSLGDFFGLEPGRNVTGMVAAALRKMGFDAVFDTDFTADLTIMEEASELIERVKSGGIRHEGARDGGGHAPGPLPMFTSCCPAWVKFAEQNYPELLPHLSSCKSPQQMMGALVKSYLAEKRGLAPENVYVVSFMPCTAKKFESERPEMGKGPVPDVDAVLTTRELARMLKIYGIDFGTLPVEEFDAPLGLTSGSGDIFAASGGVMESALRTAHYLLTGKDLGVGGAGIEFEEVRGYRGIKEAEVSLAGFKLRVAVVNRLVYAREIIRRMKSGQNTYHFIEVMTCPGGCAGGGGQIFGYEPERIRSRIESIYRLDLSRNVRLSYNSPTIKEVYDRYLGRPGSEKAHELLHTRYVPKSKRN
jgi:NADH-quinone oxidoreductase subunit G/NADP-reducing hydrogenase subunit HndD